MGGAAGTCYYFWRLHLSGKSFTHIFTDLFWKVMFFVAVLCCFVYFIGGMIGTPYGFIIAGLVWLVAVLISLVGTLLARRANRGLN